MSTVFRASVLSEVQTSRSSALPSSKNILVLGDKESGKTTLIAKLAGNEDPKKGAGLEYGFINVRDEEREGENIRKKHGPLFIIKLRNVTTMVRFLTGVDRVRFASFS